MYAQLEEDYGLAKRSMAILERATQAVADEDKFEVSVMTVYIYIHICNLSNLFRCSPFISQKRQ